MTDKTVGVLGAPEDGRVALVPDGVRRLEKLGMSTAVESGAGRAAGHSDSAYEAAGATIASRSDVLAKADIVLTVTGTAPTDLIRAGQWVVGLVAGAIEEINGRGATAVAMEHLPRTLSRCQSMDVLTSQASVAGYKAAVLAAATYGRYFPMLITAAGTSRPARVLVLGAGVAGLSAIGTSRRLGALVTGYDVRPETRTEVESLGAKFLDLASVGPAAGEGGYARALTAEEQRAQQEELEARLDGFDVVITTAAVPGRRPPLLVPASALERMRSGSVVVDMGSGPLGGNVEGSEPGRSVTTAGGIVVVGAPNLAATVAGAASDAFSANMVSLLAVLNAGTDDEVLSAIVRHPKEGADERKPAV